jgi:signal peptidase I
VQSRQEEFLIAAPALVADVVRRFGEARIRVHGGSMFPAIRSGDVLTVRASTLGQIRPGDVVVMRDAARVYAHRLVRCVWLDGAPHLVTRGDAHWRTDPPRAATGLIGRVARIARAGRDEAPVPCMLVDRARGLLASEWTRLRALARLTP